MGEYRFLRLLKDNRCLTGSKT